MLGLVVLVKENAVAFRMVRILAVLPVLWLASVAAAVPVEGGEASPGPTTDLVSSETSRILALRDIGVGYPIRLRTVFGQAGVPLSLRADQVVTRARLDLRYAHSPSLRFDLSHLSVFVNDQLVSTLPLTEATASGRSIELPLDPRLFLTYNQIRFELVAHYAQANECEDPAHSSLWLDISNDSRLMLEFSSLPLGADLERLPAPLFDAGDNRMLTLPFAFEGVPTTGQTRAAGIIAAWFGAHADYRGARFPARFGETPPGHGVVFVVGPSSLPGVPAAGGARASVRLVENAGASLLVFAAADDAALVEIAQAFALGQVVLQGNIATLSGLQLPAPRPPWSSPRWVDPSKPFRLAPSAVGPLSVTGLVPGPIGFEFNLPPDLFLLDDNSVQAHLRYRAAPVTADNSALNASINEQFAGSVRLDSKALSSVAGRHLDLVLPPGALRSRNRLDAQFHFRRDTTTPCEDFDTTSLQGGVDPESELRIRRYAHFLPMPALERLADGGFPFSRLGDLADTTLVLPRVPSENDVAAALTVLGHVGRWTGEAATRLEVASVDALPGLEGRDLLIVGAAAGLALPDDWTQHAPMHFTATQTEFRPLGRLEALSARLADRDLDNAFDYASRVAIEGGQRLAAIMAFESPLSRGRSVILLTAGRDGDVRRAADALVDPGDSQFVRGGLALIHGERVSGYDIGAGYEVGRLPWWYAIKRWFSHHPYLLAPLALIVSLAAGLLMRAMLAARAERRRKGTA